MTRSVWKGKYIIGDFCNLIHHWKYIPITKLNIYTYTHFLKIKFNLLRLYTFTAWKLKKKYLGFTLGVFFLIEKKMFFIELKKRKNKRNKNKEVKKKRKYLNRKKEGIFY